MTQPKMRMSILIPILYTPVSYTHLTLPTTNSV